MLLIVKRHQLLRNGDAYSGFACCSLLFAGNILRTLTVKHSARTVEWRQRRSYDPRIYHWYGHRNAMIHIVGLWIIATNISDHWDVKYCHIPAVCLQRKSNVSLYHMYSNQSVESVCRWLKNFAWRNECTAMSICTLTDLTKMRSKRNSMFHIRNYWTNFDEIWYLRCVPNL
jgi:hypothetical protein